MRLRALLLVAAIWALALVPASAAVFVKWDSAGPPDGTTWDTAYHSVQAGLNAASSGQEGCAKKVVKKAAPKKAAAKKPAAKKVVKKAVKKAAKK